MFSRLMRCENTGLDSVGLRLIKFDRECYLAWNCLATIPLSAQPDG